jgi:hypothetical protein
MLTSRRWLWRRIVFVAIKDANTGRHFWYEADHGVQRDPLRDAIRDHFPTSDEGWNVNDVDLRVCLFGDALNRGRNEDGWIIEFEVKKFGAALKWSQVRVMKLVDRLGSISDREKRHWGGCWMLQVPGDLDRGKFRLFRPYTKELELCVGVEGLREWIKSRAPKR